MLPEFLKSSVINAADVAPLDVLIRLIIALGFGALVAWIYRRTRAPSDIAPSFPVTLVLLSVLIAMVTQVIGDNIARAFSLVGALSIVRFRTVVRDTQDTAYVIFAVVVGMAVGARDMWVGVIGIAVVGFAAYLMRNRALIPIASAPIYELSLRVGLGFDLENVLGSIFDAHLQKREIISMGTAKQGTSLDVTYEATMRPSESIELLVKTLNKIEGIQSVELERHSVDQD